MPLLALLAYAGAAVSTLLACGVLFRNRRSIAQWAFSSGMLALAVESAIGGLGASTSSEYASLAWQQWRHAMVGFVPGPWVLFSLLYSRGAVRETVQKQRWLIGASFVLPLILALYSFKQLDTGRVYDPDTGHDVLVLGSAGLGLHVLMLAASVFVLANLERTYRAAVGTIRWRIKYVLLAIGVIFGARLYTSTQTLLFGELDASLGGFRSGALLIAGVLLTRGLVRTGHFEMTVYPSRAVLQNSLTVMLAGLYLIVVGVFAQAVSWFGGDAGFALKAFILLLALVILALMLQSDRLRLQLRRFVSRHFQRPHYEYRSIWMRCTAGTTSCVDERDLARAVVRLASDIFQSLSTTLWLVNPDRETLEVKASTHTAPENWNQLNLGREDTADLSRHFQQHPETVDLESTTATWADALRQRHGSTFPHGGHRVCTPIVNRGEVLGLLLLGDRVSGIGFTAEDFDLLHCIANHAAAGLANVHLARQLGHSREIAAMQTMATFLVHDLKNATSTLNLMLKNLPVHYDDPEFRADALRGISKTVAHMNELTGRLGTFRRELSIRPTASANLNKIIERVLATCPSGPEVRVEKNLAVIPAVNVDAEQIGSVITNLLINAREALSGGGTIQITTRQDHGWVRLSVTDDGCGMSPEFLRDGLFRPFQTTKQGGMGIGMFQSKTIVEAHGGRISVESTVGKGSTFHVLLPLPAEATSTESETSTKPAAADSASLF